MKVGEAIKQAVESQDFRTVGRIVDFMRFRKGMNYKQIQEVACSVWGFDSAKWETLMEQADLADSESDDNDMDN